MLTVTDGTNSLTANLTVEASIIVNPTSGVAGDGVGLAGYGFGANKTITVTLNNAQVSLLSPVMTDASGIFSGAQFYIPASAGGAGTIKATDGTITKSIGFTVESSTTISDVTSTSTPGYVGMQLSISGCGYAANAPVTVTYASSPVTLYSGTTSNIGSFTAAITIPASAAGEHAITVKVNNVEVEQYAFVMESAVPLAPGLATIYFGSKAEEPFVFDWNEVTDNSLPVTYNLQIFTVTNNVETPVLTKTGLTGTEYTLTEAEAVTLLPLEKNEYYYWHVQAVDAAANASAWSSADTFTIGGAGIGWPSWLTWVLVGVGALIFFILAIWLGRRMAFSSY